MRATEHYGDPCPNCRHDASQHVGGTCYFGWHHCGWVRLGQGNAWKMEPGWYSGKVLNEKASTMDKPPFSVIM